MEKKIKKKLPDFLIVGAQKSGTTTLYDILNNHPEVNMSKTKEINFFTSEKKFSKGLSYYSTFFDKSIGNQKIMGEATPGYMNYYGVAEKIYDSLGDIKIIMILRDPIKRAYSQYWDNRRHLKENMSENKIVSKYLSSTYNSSSRGYFSRGVYIKYIEDYLRFFSRENIHIIIFENFIKNPRDVILELYDFLGIDNSQPLLNLKEPSNSSIIWENPIYMFFLKNPQYNKYIPKNLRRLLFFGRKRKYKYNLPDEKTLNTLKRFYKNWNKKLEDFLSIKLNDWI